MSSAESDVPTDEEVVYRQRGTRRLLAVLAVLGFGLPVIAYFWAIHSYSVNTPVLDQWSDIQLISNSFHGHFGLSQIWALHNENRILFPNLIVLLLSRSAHFNIVLEEYLGAGLLVIAVGLIVMAHRRRLGPIAWVFYCPVVIVMLSLVQYENTLWGFQLAWYLVLVAVAVSLFLLDRFTMTWLVLSLAMASGIVASYSSLQGLIVWPVGLLLLALRRRRLAFTLTWVLVAIATVAVYFAGYNSADAGSHSYALLHPIEALRYTLMAIGNVVGINVTGPDTTNPVALVIGVLIVVLSVWALCSYWLQRRQLAGGPIAVALIGFGLLFAATVTAGRTYEGLSTAGASRYTTFDLMIVVGLYLVVLEQCWLRWYQRQALRPGIPPAEEGRASPQNRGGFGVSLRSPLSVAAAILVVIICLQVVMGTQQGLSGSRSTKALQESAARVTADIDRYPEGFVIFELNQFESLGHLRSLTAMMARHHLSLFAGDGAARLRALGPVPVPFQIPETNVMLPPAGSVIRGSRLLDAAVSGSYDVVNVQFEVTGPGLDQAVVSIAGHSPYGWLGLWKTSTAANGRYLLQSVVTTAIGTVVRSHAIPVFVENH